MLQLKNVLVTITRVTWHTPGRPPRVVRCGTLGGSEVQSLHRQARAHRDLPEGATTAQGPSGLRASRAVTATMRRAGTCRMAGTPLAVGLGRQPTQEGSMEWGARSKKWVQQRERAFRAGQGSGSRFDGGGQRTYSTTSGHCAV